MIGRLTIAILLAASVAASAQSRKVLPNGGKPYPCWQVRLAANTIYRGYTDAQLDALAREKGVTPAQKAAAKACMRRT